MSIKPKRTLGPAAFEAYMNFADSLKNGTNNDEIDRFKYRFAVHEGYIRPKRKNITESAGRLTMADFETAFQGFVGAFLPHMDADEQEILSRVCANVDKMVNNGDISGAADAIKGAIGDAGGDPDAFEGDEFDVDGCDEGDQCDDDTECGEGECCEGGECVKPDETDGGEEGESGEDDGDSGDEGDSDGEAGEDGKKQSGKKPSKDKANDGKFNFEAIDMGTPGFGADSTEFELGDETGDDVDSILGRNHDLGVYNPEGTPKEPAVCSDDTEDYGASSDVDYDALADLILSENGYGNMTTSAGGVGEENRRFMGR